MTAIKFDGVGTRDRRTAYILKFEQAGNSKESLFTSLHFPSPWTLAYYKFIIHLTLFLLKRGPGPAYFSGMRTPLFLGGLLLVALGAGLQTARQLVSPKISEKINEAIVKQIVWQPDSPPSVKGESDLKSQDASFSRRVFFVERVLAVLTCLLKSLLQNALKADLTTHPSMSAITFSILPTLTSSDKAASLCW